MNKYIISHHYDGMISVKFYPESHRYQLNGRKDYLIGVTTATGMLDKSRPLMIWASKLTKKFLLDALAAGENIDELVIEAAVNQHNVKREEAATSGQLVHKWAESYIAGDNPEVPEDENVRNGVLAFLKWVNENDIKFVASEKMIYSKKHEYVGTMDCIFTMGKENHEILHAGDFKTSSGFYVEQVFQVAGYQEAHTEEFGTKFGAKCIIRFDKETGEFHEKWFAASEHKNHFEGFLSCLRLKQLSKEWDKTHGYYAKKS